MARPVQPEGGRGDLRDGERGGVRGEDGLGRGLAHGQEGLLLTLPHLVVILGEQLLFERHVLRHGLQHQVRRLDGRVHRRADVHVGQRAGGQSQEEVTAVERPVDELGPGLGVLLELLLGHPLDALGDPGVTLIQHLEQGAGGAGGAGGVKSAGGVIVQVV